MSQQQGNDMRLEDSSQDEGTVTSPRAIEDKLISEIGLLLQNYDNARGQKEIDKAINEGARAFQAIITTETTNAVQADRTNILGLVSELSRRYARYGDHHIVYHREEAVIPVSEVLKLHAQLNDLLVTDRKRAQSESDAPSNALQKEQNQ